MEIDRYIHIIISHPSASSWLSDALRAAFKRDLIDDAHADEHARACAGLDRGVASACRVKSS
jgi:hypothetical protein